MPTFIDQLGTDIMKIPPITRFISGSAVAVTLAEMGRYVDHRQLLFQKDMVFGKLQLWRLYTSFFAGGNEYGYRHIPYTFILDLMILHRMLSDLETKSYRHSPADLSWQLFMACIVIIIATLPLNIDSFSRPLLTCIVYLRAAFAEPGEKINFYRFFHFDIPLVYLPIALIAYDYFIGGPKYVGPSVAGAVVGHLWWWVVWEGRGDLQIRLARLVELAELFGGIDTLVLRMEGDT
ncbi:Derlin-3 [Psilocybe cubensis]|uniref:Derlin-3 n=1 Tax=Psilocybe cubensis TaxID=181762 RepID=A0ACB8GQS7_PSICU|nr:Derlin-3 [Psilocybe cubensis]KAH9477566.1 Derlin-3 [Psilocybe cubensis]